MRALAPPNVELIRKLEEKSHRDPAGYRLRVGLLSAMGNLALTVIILLPIFIPAIVVMLISSNAVIHWAAGLSLLLFLWILRPTHHEINPVLQRKEAPALYAALDDLRARLGVGYEMQIILTDDFNAGALEMPGLLGSLGTRRTLYLGVPLLCALRPQEALGVIGHELGHFSRRHGLLGQRIYRTRQGWFSYTDADRHDSTLEQGAAAFARMFVPFFNSYTFVYGRRCEYEADADAASVVGSSTMAQALARTDVFNRIQEENFGAELARAQRESAEPPADFADRIIRSAARQEQTVLDHHLQLALAQKSDWLDTHPCLAERIAALGVEARLEPLAGPCAGEALLGEAWPAAKQKFSREWQDAIRARWALEHARQHHFAGLLELPADAAGLKAWPLDQRLARADLLAVHQPAQAIAELREVLADHAQHSGASYALGALLLKSSPQEAIVLLEHAAKQDHGFRVAAYEMLEAHFTRQGDAQTAYNYARRLERAGERRAHAARLFRREIGLGRFRPVNLPEGSAALVHEAGKAYPCVTGGWMLSRDPDAPPPPPNPYEDAAPPGPWLAGQALILMVDPDRMQSAKLTEDELAGRYADCLRSIVPPNQLAVVRVLYTSEVFAPELKRALDALPDMCRI